MLPNSDLRYLILIETLILFCGDVLDYDASPGGFSTPKIYLRLFDTFDEVLPGPLTVEAKRTGEHSAATVSFDLKQIFGTENLAKKVLFFSETETKTLRVTFPSPEREPYFLHIAFTHLDSPGALLAISTLIKRCGFNILTSLLRKVDRNDNVWEVMLERTSGRGGRSRATEDKVPSGFSGVCWFREKCFNGELGETVDLLPFMSRYEVRVSRPSYPRKFDSPPDEFEPRDIRPEGSLDSNLAVEPQFMLSMEHINARLSLLHVVQQENPTFESVARLVFYDFRSRLPHTDTGRVFISLPTYCGEHKAIIEAKFKALRFETDSYTVPLSADNMHTALRKIRDADYFFGLWQHESNIQTEVSPWLPFEYGVALALGKPTMVLPHEKLRRDVRDRLERGTTFITYSDITFERQLDQVLKRLKSDWRNKKLQLNVTG